MDNLVNNLSLNNVAWYAFYLIYLIFFMRFQWRLFNVGKSIWMSLFDLNILHNKDIRNLKVLFKRKLHSVIKLFWPCCREEKSDGQILAIN